jgi:uncharacterized protein YndB with AHSA1/START domain
MNHNVARTDLLVRATPRQVFDAFVQPDMIEKFWLRRTSGPLAHGVTVDWEFMAEGSTERVTVTDVRAPNLIAYSWSSGIDVELRLDAFGDDGTRVAVTAGGFEGEDAAAQAVAATAGFTVVLCDLKSFLETGRSGNMVRDKAALIDADNAAS